MNLTTYTTIYAIGSINEIKKFKNSLPIDDNLFDFGKIYPIPLDMKNISSESPKDELDKLNTWCLNNWGSMGNGLIEKISEIYGYQEMGLEIRLSTPLNEPIHIIDKITQRFSSLNYFVHHISCFEDEYIGFKSKNLSEIKTLSEEIYDDHYEEWSYSINEDILLELVEFSISPLHWEFLKCRNIGKHIIENLQYIHSQDKII